MDEFYNHRKDYSGKLIYNDVSLSDLYKLLLKLEPNNWRDYNVTYTKNNYSRRGFGIGSVQWTFERSKLLVELYIVEANGNDTITFEQALRAEGLVISNEFQGSSNETVYSPWKSQYSRNLSSADAAYAAGSIICEIYERPTDWQTKRTERGNTAIKVYNIMMGN